mgnify:CR=1 FL=1
MPERSPAYTYAGVVNGSTGIAGIYVGANGANVAGYQFFGQNFKLDLPGDPVNFRVNDHDFDFAGNHNLGTGLVGDADGNLAHQRLGETGADPANNRNRLAAVAKNPKPASEKVPFRNGTN